MTFFKIMHTDNFGGDYPDEKFVEGLGNMNPSQAAEICDAINRARTDDSRYYRVVPHDYVLVPGFKP